MGKIVKIQASEVINSRGYPTLFVSLKTDNNIQTSISIPSFEKKFPYQKYQLVDNDENRFSGKGVTKACYIINQLIDKKLKNVSLDKFLEIDNWLLQADPTKNKNKLGVNILSSISYVVAKAVAKEKNLHFYQYVNELYNQIFQEKIIIDKLPTPVFPLLMGSFHGQVNLDFKEFQIVPSSAFSYSQSYQIGVDLYHLFRHLYRFEFNYNLDAVEGIISTINKKNLKFERDVFLGINFSAENFYQNNLYQIKDKEQSISINEYFTWIEKTINQKYKPLILVDPFNNQDFESWKKLNALISQDSYLCADDLIGSDYERILKVIENKLVNTIVIRPGQTGTMIEFLKIVNLARKNNLSYIIASDLEETDDHFVADLAVGLKSEYINFGIPVHGENVVKYNRLLAIENEINKK